MLERSSAPFHGTGERNRQKQTVMFLTMGCVGQQRCSFPWDWWEKQTETDSHVPYHGSCRTAVVLLTMGLVIETDSHVPYHGSCRTAAVLLTMGLVRETDSSVPCRGLHKRERQRYSLP